jgi:hypothetical protein
MLELLVTAISVLGAGLTVNLLGPRLGRDAAPRRTRIGSTAPTPAPGTEPSGT